MRERHAYVEERARGNAGIIEGTPAKGRVVCSRLGLIQVQRRCRRLYDDKEHLGDRRARNFLVAQTSHLYTVVAPHACLHAHDARYTHHTCVYATSVKRRRVCVYVSHAPPVTVAWDQFVSGRELAVMRLR